MAGEELEIVEAPARGSLAWLLAQPKVEHAGEEVPSCHRIPLDATLCPPDDTGKCRVTSVTGERCKGTRLRALGLCMGHAGGGGAADLEGMRAKSAEKRASLKMSRQLLGIGPRRAADPRAAVRLRSAQRASELAAAIVDGPLDAELGAVERQRAALAVLDAAWPLQAGTVTLELSNPEGMNWEDMERLAASLLG